MNASNPRSAKYERRTKETTVSVALTLDGASNVTVSTGIGFLDHLLTALAYHAGFDLDLQCDGDLHVDDHHTAEDCALALGAILDRALGDRSGISRFGYACAPLDDALVRAVVDLSGRSWCSIDLPLKRDTIGTLAAENVRHVLASFALSARMNLHVDCLRGENDHHVAEAAFKAVALALRTAVALRGQAEVPSTKGAL